MIAFISKRCFDTSVFSEDKRFELWFKSICINLTPNDESEPPMGLYLLERNDDGTEDAKINEYKAVHYVPCHNYDWHNAECEMLAAIDDMGYCESDKDIVRELVWNEIVHQTREELEKGRERLELD